MLDELQDRVISYLSKNRVCIIATNGLLGVWAVQAQYENDGLKLKCCLPNWLDAAFYLEQEPQVIVIIQDANPMRWLQYRGTACITDSTNDRYTTIFIVPNRIDLIDGDRGWSSRETLDI